MSCTDPSGEPLTGVDFTKSADCSDGTYYRCTNGNECQAYLVTYRVFIGYFIFKSGVAQQYTCPVPPGSPLQYIYSTSGGWCVDANGVDCTTISTDSAGKYKWPGVHLKSIWLSPLRLWKNLATWTNASRILNNITYNYNCTQRYIKTIKLTLLWFIHIDYYFEWFYFSTQEKEESTEKE